MSNPVRIRLIAAGQVQGVGFRPFIWRLANESNLSGFCQNTSAGVVIEVQGIQATLEIFQRDLVSRLPPLAKLTSLTKTEIAAKLDETGFTILPSAGHASQSVLVSPDVATCPDCLSDMRDPDNPRFAYAFTNCTNCGPRFSITTKIPYDRPFTTMGCFELCQNCAREYSNPADRRFHAQPVACPACGPSIWFVSAADVLAGRTLPDQRNTVSVIAKAGRMLMEGGIIALRGLGGFQLVCDARNRNAVSRLRARKSRPHKALALMAGDIATCRQFCEIDIEEENLLCGRQKPIVLCRAKAGIDFLEWIAPDSLDLGLMLPYTPLHSLLFDWFGANGHPDCLLVMTSGNLKGEPICLGNREALASLEHLADAFLLHDRDILCRVDDSIVRIRNGQPSYLRRARGYTPEPVPLPRSGPCVLGTGAELKAAFCLTRGSDAFTGQHIGDLTSPACMEFYEAALAHLMRLLEAEPELIAHDLHPDFFSTHFARQLAMERKIPILGVQHHLAHAASCLAENGFYSPALALCLDGSGLGYNGEIWGGELLRVDLARADWQRLGSLKPFRLPGGESAILEPWRISTALKWQAGLHETEKREKPIREMLKRKLNCPQTTSCGRLFDAAAAQLGICEKITYEGQAAIRLEKLALTWLEHHALPQTWDLNIVKTNSLIQLDSVALFNQLIESKAESTGEIAAAFHNALALGFAKLAASAANELSLNCVAICGGVMQNTLFTVLLCHYLEEQGLKPLKNMALPPGDGGLSYGQAVWGRQILANSKKVDFP